MFGRLQLPLHSGRTLGTPGRIAISAMGIIVAVLPITGLVIWWRKRAARRSTAKGRPGAEQQAQSTTLTST